MDTKVILLIWWMIRTENQGCLLACLVSFLLEQLDQIHEKPSVIKSNQTHLPMGFNRLSMRIGQSVGQGLLGLLLGFFSKMCFVVATGQVFVEKSSKTEIRKPEIPIKNWKKNTTRSPNLEETLLKALLYGSKGWRHDEKKVEKTERGRFELVLYSIWYLYEEIGIDEAQIYISKQDL